MSGWIVCSVQQSALATLLWSLTGICEVPNFSRQLCLRSFPSGRQTGYWAWSTRHWSKRRHPIRDVWDDPACQTFSSALLQAMKCSSQMCTNKFSIHFSDFPAFKQLIFSNSNSNNSLHICIYAYIWMCIYSVYIYVCVFIHTYTHTLYICTYI